jgi:hypothetical protein
MATMSILCYAMATFLFGRMIPIHDAKMIFALELAN